MAKGMAAKMPGIVAHGECVFAGPAVLAAIVGKGEAGCDHTHEDQQFENRQQGDHELEGCGDAHTEDIEAHENDVGAERGHLWV